MRSGVRQTRIAPYKGAAGGYGSVDSVADILLREGLPIEGAELIAKQNKPDGFMCVSCSWGKPAKPHPMEVCENGVKATAWEVTKRRVGPEFFAKHTLTELEGWGGHELEQLGRLTYPLKWDRESDKYVPIAWEQAFSEIGEQLRALRNDPDQVVFYVSGRASLEASYMWQLLARMYGTNNLPDSSNMCHESTSVALPESIGASVGTAGLQDFEMCDLILYWGHNPGTSSPRILHQLQEAAQRGCKIIGVNPLKERGLQRFKNPQNPIEMLTPKETQIADKIYQVRNGGDTALLAGLCKALIAWDDALAERGKAHETDRQALLEKTKDDGGFASKAAAEAAESRAILDHDFIATHTHGFEDFAQWCRAADWGEIERVSGISRGDIEEFAAAYSKANAVLGIYGMGLTQHVGGSQNIHMLMNLMLLRGNIGKPGAQICPVRGHSNVQGQRTVGITEKPELAPLEQLKDLYGFEPPRHKGLSTVEACEAMISGRVKAFICLGGNFPNAAPDLQRVEAAWRQLPLTVNIATKLNRSHVIHGKSAYLLPCISRIEFHREATGDQAVSMESSIAHFHGSRGQVEPASPDIKTEHAIVAGIAKATLEPNAKVPWDTWVGDFSIIRHQIEKTWPATFKGLNENMFKPGGIRRPLAARERKWNTRTGKANFIPPKQMFAGDAKTFGQEGVLQLVTLRSNGQFNTTVYSFRDRFRGVEGTRMVAFVNPADIERLGMADGDMVDLVTAMDEETPRRVNGLRLTAFDIPEGCVGSYYPEANPLVPLSHHDTEAKTPAYKATPVRVLRSEPAAA